MTRVKRRVTKRGKIVIPLFIVLLCTVLAMVLVYGSTYKVDDRMSKGVSISRINVGGMTKEQAKSVIDNYYNEKMKDKVIKMVYGDKVYSIDYKTLKAHYDVDTAIEKAFKYGKDENILTKALNNLGLSIDKHNVELKFLTDTSKVNSLIKRISRKINKDPVEAKITLENGSFIVTHETNGIKVDAKKLSQLVKDSITTDYNDVTLDIPTETVEPKMKAEALTKIDTELSTFTTSFKTSDAARSGNIRIAALAVDGTVVLPGEVFSMNKAVGPRVASKGYKEAHVIVNGELVDGLAGGICQATTTVYNAALLGNFEIVTRRAHGLKVGYVKAGRDATISGDYIDFKFKNNNKYPIYIHTIIRNGTVTAKIYGANEHPGMSVQIESQVLEVIPPKDPVFENDPTLYKGQEKVEVKPINGYRSIAYRKVYQDGVLVKTELLSKDKYQPERARILVGTKPLKNANSSTNKQ